jgi:hypothetical protein
MVWWEWFLTTILTVGPTEFLAVENRSHNFIELFSGYKDAGSSIKLATSPLDARLTPETYLHYFTIPAAFMILPLSSSAWAIALAKSAEFSQ